MDARGAWGEAEGAANAAGVELESLESLDAATLITDVAVATWGPYGLVPREVIRALQESGNEPWGAFHNGRMVGYVLDWLGMDEEGLHVHSHMLAVHKEWQTKGVGFALKLAQRALALERGIDLVRWTFDPLLARNAHFNFAKLGTFADGFRPNFYGTMADDLNRGERSDRLVIRWELDRDVDPGRVPDEGVVVLDRQGPEDLPQPVPGAAPGRGPAIVRIPPHYRMLRKADAALAERWRAAVGDALQACFDAGLTVTGLSASTAYVLS